MEITDTFVQFAVRSANNSSFDNINSNRYEKSKRQRMVSSYADISGRTRLSPVPSTTLIKTL